MHIPTYIHVRMNIHTHTHTHIHTSQHSGAPSRHTLPQAFTASQISRHFRDGHLCHGAHTPSAKDYHRPVLVCLARSSNNVPYCTGPLQYFAPNYATHAGILCENELSGRSSVQPFRHGMYACNAAEHLAPMWTLFTGNFGGN